MQDANLARAGVQSPPAQTAGPQDAAPQVVQTRFGPLPVQAHQIWRSTSPLPGFESLQSHALIGLENERPFLWLQSIDDAAVSFLLAPAAQFGLRYGRVSAASLPMVMVLLPGQVGQPLRAHGQAPLVFDAQTGQFAQHIIEAAEVEGDGVFDPQVVVPLPSGLAARMLALGTS
nr:flagellar assembly protein FliW [Thiomonas intermedia]